MAILADFHNHSCLSPCGSLELSPRTLCSLAAERGIQLLALTDHNSTKNCPAFAISCVQQGILPLFGTEVNTQEEVHVLCLFGNLEAALAFGDHLFTLLPPFKNDPVRLGDQVYVDSEDIIQGEVEYYLGSALDIGVDDIGPRAHDFGGIVIPAHVDRAAYSMASQLGFLVDGPWAAVECLHIPTNMDTKGYPLTTSSDAHHPEHVARRAFSLDIELEALQPAGPGGDIDLSALKAALDRRPRA